MEFAKHDLVLTLTPRDVAASGARSAPQAAKDLKIHHAHFFLYLGAIPWPESIDFF